jgi:hypothetical protein
VHQLVDERWPLAVGVCSRVSILQERLELAALAPKSIGACAGDRLGKRRPATPQKSDQLLFCGHTRKSPMPGSGTQEIDCRSTDASMIGDLKLGWYHFRARLAVVERRCTG